MKLFSMGYALLATQRALLNAVSPELRAVIVNTCEEEELFYIRLYYDGDATERSIELWWCVITEASAAFGHCMLDDGVERLDYPQKIPCRGRYAYLRREKFQKPIISRCAENFTEIRREIVEFQEDIGIFISPLPGEPVSTRWGVIHDANGKRETLPAKPPSCKIEITPVAYALLAIQRALLGIVTPELRAVIADLGEEGSSLYIRFYYDGEISSQVFAEWEHALTESIATVGPGYSFDVGIERVPYPQKVPFRGRYAYIRKEESIKIS